MAEIVNLHRARKARIRAESDAKAAENRALFGRTRQERDRQSAERAQAVRKLEGHRLREDDADGS